MSAEEKNEGFEELICLRRLSREVCYWVEVYHKRAISNTFRAIIKQLNTLIERLFYRFNCLCQLPGPREMRELQKLVQDNEKVFINDAPDLYMIVVVYFKVLNQYYYNHGKPTLDELPPSAQEVAAMAVPTEPKVPRNSPSSTPKPMETEKPTQVLAPASDEEVEEIEDDDDDGYDTEPQLFHAVKTKRGELVLVEDSEGESNEKPVATPLRASEVRTCPIAVRPPVVCPIPEKKRRVNLQKQN